MRFFSTKEEMIAKLDELKRKQARAIHNGWFDDAQDAEEEMDEIANNSNFRL